MYLRSFADIYSPDPYIGIQVDSDHPLRRSSPFASPPWSVAISPFCGVGAAHNDNYRSPPREECIDRPAPMIDTMIYDALEGYWVLFGRMLLYFTANRNVKLAYRFKLGDRRKQSGARRLEIINGLKSCGGLRSSRNLESYLLVESA